MKKALFFAFMLIVITQASALQFARWHTSMGDFTCKLYDDIVPITAGNFVTLANSGFYNDLIFHRVVAGFVIQDGDPLGTGYGGPGYTIPDEFSPLLNHNQAGTLAMARTSAPNSAGSQYYITLAPTPHLNGSYAVFGQVIEGLDTVLAIGEVPTNTNGLPVTPVNIHTLSIVDLDIGNVTPPIEEPVVATAGETVMFIVESSSNNGLHTYKWFAGTEELVGQTDFLLEIALNPTTPQTITCRISQGDFSYDTIWNISLSTSSDDALIPNPVPGLTISPNPTGGMTSIGFTSRKSGTFSVSVFDLRGRIIREEEGIQSYQGPNTWNWDGCDNSGKRLAPGIYLIKLSTPDGVQHGKAVIQ